MSRSRRGRRRGPRARFAAPPPWPIVRDRLKRARLTKRAPTRGRIMSAANFRQLMGGDELIVAPVALNPIMARLAEEAGFKAVYLSGGSLGWLKCVTEANLGVAEMVQVVLDMR